MENIFLKIKGLNLHYRRTGDGPVIFLLHPSPRNSKMMVPLMNQLEDSFTIIAPDMPGYGFSEPLKQTPDSLYDYIDCLHELVTSITPNPVAIYGTATGAQLAIAYGLSHPENTLQLFLDNAAHFSDDECEEILVNYFPDFTAQPDGSHLQKIWQHICDSSLYFPWYDKKEENRIAAQLPPAEILQEIMNDYVLAGVNYATAYKAAFKHERAEILQQLICNTIIFKWMGSPVLKYIDKLLLHRFPQNIKIAETPANNKKRYEAMKKEMILSLKK